MLCWQSWSAGSRRSDVTGGASDSGGAVGRPDPSSVRWELALCFRQQWAYSWNIPCQIQPLGEYWLFIWNKCGVCCVQLVGTCICGAGMKAGSSVCHLEAWRRKNAEQIVVKGLKYIWLYIWMYYCIAACFCFCLGNTDQTINKDETNQADVFISIQAFPALVDIPNVSEISRISCGSRHTAAVTGDIQIWSNEHKCLTWKIINLLFSYFFVGTGDLYTWGWGKSLLCFFKK